MRVGTRNARLRLVVALTVWALGGGVAAAAETPLTLHPAVGDTVDAAEARCWNLFPDLRNLESAVFVRSEAGGIVARIALKDGRRRERSVAADDFAGWRARIEAGEPADDPLPVTEGPVWPERALRPEDAAPPRHEPVIPAGEASLADDWVMLLDVGWKHSTTRFGDYFTDMMMADVLFGFAASERVIPFLAFQVGFGDLQDDLEDLTGNGKSAVFALEGGLRVTAPVSERLDLAVGAAGGYYMRSLRWGGDVYYGYDGATYGGALVRELSDWGAGFRLGVQYALPPKAGQARYLDVSLRYETYPGDPVVLTSTETGLSLLADDRDAWWGVSVGFLFGL